MTNSKEGVSVVICTYNGRQRLQPTLHSIGIQRFHPSLFELIVVDNASQDGTHEFCERYLSEWDILFSWKVVNENQPGLSHARLKGFREAQFDIVLFCDDDNSLSPDYLKVGFDLLKNNSVIGALGGCGIPSFETSKPEWFDKYSHSFAVGPQADRDGKVIKYPSELYGAGTFFRKAALQKYFDKGFNPIMSDRKGNMLVSGGDVEWCYLIQLNQYEIWYEHRLSFLHVMPDSRMQWSYYLKLKQGIASGAGKLFPYECLLKNRKMTIVSFGFRWLARALFSSLVYLKYEAGKWVTRQTVQPDAELARLILHAKMNSYWMNGRKAFHHFVHLKSML